MKTKILIFLFLAIGFINGMATDFYESDIIQEDPTFLVIEMSDGSQISYSFTDLPKLSFDDENLCITTSELTVAYTFSDLKRYYFNNTMTGVDREPMSPLVIFDGKNFMFNLNKSKEEIRVFSLSGKEVASAITDNDGSAFISLQSLPKGIFIIKFLNTITKIFN